MEIKNLIRPEFIKMELSSRDKEGVIKELIQVLYDNGLVTDREEVFKKAMEREEKGSTGVGNQVAIPHVKTSAVKKPAVIFGKSAEGIDFESMDGNPAKLFFLIAVPEDSDDKHLKILANLSRKLVHKDFREGLLAAENKEKVREVISGE